MSKKQPPTISDQLREALKNRIEGGVSARQIARESGVAYPVITRFVSGLRSMKLESVDQLCAYFGFELRSR